MIPGDMSSAGERYAAAYGAHTEAYLRHLDPTLLKVHRRLIELAKVQAGDRVLDIATGTGAIARLAAAAGATVVGADISPGMVDRARAVSPPGLTFEVADAAALPFPDGRFDAVTCGFGFSHMPDPLRVVREARRVLRDGGRLVESSWGANGESAAFSAVLGALRRYSPDGVHAFAGILDEDTWADAERGRALIAEAGFDDVRVVVDRVDGTFDSAADALNWTLAWPDYGATFSALPEGARAAFTGDALAAAGGVDLDWWFEINYYVAAR